MPEIHPFRAVRYDAGAFNMASIVSPPYDIISPDLQNELYRRHSFNAVRLELPKEENGYALAAERFRQWGCKAYSCVKRRRRCLLYERVSDAQVWRRPGGGSFAHWRGGMVAREHPPTRTDALRTKRRPLENPPRCPSQSQPRVRHLCRSLPEIAGRLKNQSGTPLIDIVDDHNERQLLYRCTDDATIRFAAEQLKNAKIYIADAQHRYETALAYRDEMRAAHPDAPADAPWNFILAFLGDMNDDALEIQPTHQLWLRFRISSGKRSNENLRRSLRCKQSPRSMEDAPN